MDPAMMIIIGEDDPKDRNILTVNARSRYHQSLGEFRNVLQEGGYFEENNNGNDHHVDVLHLIDWTLNEDMTQAVIEVIDCKCGGGETAISLRNIATTNQSNNGNGNNNHHNKSSSSFHLLLDNITQDCQFFCQLLFYAAQRVDKLTLMSSNSSGNCSTSAQRLLTEQASRVLCQGISLRYEQYQNTHTFRPLQRLTICGMDLDQVAVQSLSTFLGTHNIHNNSCNILALALIDNNWIDAIDDGSADYFAQLLAKGLAANTSLKEFRLYSLTTPNDSAFPSDKNLAKIICEGFRRHPNIQKLLLDDRIWHEATIRAIGKLLREDDGKTDSDNDGHKSKTILTANTTACERPRLTHLELSRQHLATRSRHGVTPKLRLSPLLLEDGLERNTSLQTLTLRECHLDNIDFCSLLKSAGHCPTLTELDVSQNRISSLALVAKKNVDNTTNDPQEQSYYYPPTALRRLDLTGNPACPTRCHHLGRAFQTLYVRRGNRNRSTTTTATATDDDKSLKEPLRLRECDYLKRILENNPLLCNLGREELTETSVCYSPYAEHLLDMNKCGRILVTPRDKRPIAYRDYRSTTTNSDKEMPMTIWPQVFERAGGAFGVHRHRYRRSANVIYHLLRGHFCHGPSLFDVDS